MSVERAERLARSYRTYETSRGWTVTGKTSASPLTSATLFNITGTIEIRQIVGTVLSTIQSQSTTLQLNRNLDGGGSVSLSTAGLDVNGGAIGTKVYCPRWNTGAMTTSAQYCDLTLTCTTGIIAVSYGAASSGSIGWALFWRPTGSGGTVSAA